MKITVFTSNQPRHISLIEKLSSITKDVFAVIETTTLFPGKTEDYYKKSPVMEEYFEHVINAEKQVFGEPRFLPKYVRTLNIKMEDVSRIPLNLLSESLNSDLYIVFGASYIQGALADFLVSHGALNIHMGISPYYRGSSCNFWALNDQNIHLVGATIHLLSKGLDSGNILFHALPSYDKDPFVFGMKAVEAAHKGLISRISDKTIKKLKPIVQNKKAEIRYTRNADFTDEVAKKYLNSMPSAKKILEGIKKRNASLFYNQYTDI